MAFGTLAALLAAAGRAGLLKASGEIRRPAALEDPPGGQMASSQWLGCGACGGKVRVAWHL